MKQRGVYTNRRTSEYSPSLDNISEFLIWEIRPIKLLLSPGPPSSYKASPTDQLNRAQNLLSKGWGDKSEKQKKKTDTDTKSGDAKACDADEAG